MLDSIPSNPLLERLPKHLRQYIKPQNYENYTAQNQAVWRYVMRKNVDYLSTVAHTSYNKGLKQTGISIDSIPNMYGMNRILQEIGWAAVAVDGFIPPAAFMEFQAYNVLVIASDIRQIENIEYTPAPDIIHEGAGHAPIIANPEYAEYLRRFGEIGCKAISSARDYELYEAVRHLSILKEERQSSEKEILKAAKAVTDIQNSMGPPSEMAQIRNLHWWTVEYGLIGTLENPKIYGAGLLSSIGESAWCMSASVEKTPYSIATANQSFDITKPQPKLYVTPDFAHLSSVLEEFANTMALRTGGLSGIEKLVASKNLGTVELSTGLQVSGLFTEFVSNGKGGIAYFNTTGATALAYRNKELIGHGTLNHPMGFGTAIGKLKGINLAIEDMSPRDLTAYDIYEGERVCLEFEGNITVDGEIITGTRNLKGQIVLISFKNCTVKHGEKIIFKPAWGVYDMAVGQTISSAFSGPADTNSFDLSTHDLSTSKANPPSGKEIEKQRIEDKKNELYTSIRALREGKNSAYSLDALATISEKEFVDEWLLALEIYELLYVRKSTNDQELAATIKKRLNSLKLVKPHLKNLINDGFSLLKSY